MVLSLLEQAQPSGPMPAAFFLHFDPAYHRGQAAVDRHLEYFRHTGMDFVKIQLEISIPEREMRAPRDWSLLPPLGADVFDPHLRIVEGLVKAVKGEALVILTLYNAFMLACKTAGADTVARHAAEDPLAFVKGMAILADGLTGFVRSCARLGLDGFYMSTQGGEKGRLADPGLFSECVRPFDLQVMGEADNLCAFNILHVCDYHLPYGSLAPFTGYPGQVVNTSLKLADGETNGKEVSALFRRPFMGGMDRLGVISRGTPQEIRKAAEDALLAAPPRFILGADCTVPSETPWENLRMAVETAHQARR
jgi:uroporphyrinogen decarboxylase